MSVMSMNRIGSLSERRRGGILLGCGIVIGVLILIAVIAGFYVANNWRGWLAGPMKMATNQYINESTLESNQRDRLRMVSDAFWEEFTDKNITIEKAQNVWNDISTSPAIGSLRAAHAIGAHVNQSSLTDEEKADAAVQLNRIARAYFFSQITKEQLDEVFGPVSEVQTNEDGGPTFTTPKDATQVSEADIKDMISRATRIADENQIPAEPIEIDIAGEILFAIENSLNQTLPVADNFGPRLEPENRPTLDVVPGDDPENNDG